MSCWFCLNITGGLFWRGISWTSVRCILVNAWVCRKRNDRVLFTRELFLVASVEHATYSCLFAMAGYCIVLPVRIEGKGSGESPCALIPTWRYVISRNGASDLVQYLNVTLVAGLMGNVWTARAHLVSAVIIESFILRKQKSFLLQYCPVCRRRIVAAIRDRVPRDVQHCGVMLVFVYLTDYTEQILVWEASSFAANQESPAFCASREFSTVFTKASHLSMIWVGRIQSTLSHPCMHFLLYGLRVLPI
jgi:hypothetical protein